MSYQPPDDWPPPPGAADYSPFGATWSQDSGSGTLPPDVAPAAIDPLAQPQGQYHAEWAKGTNNSAAPLAPLGAAAPSSGGLARRSRVSMVALALVLVMVGALVGAAITAAALATARPKTSTPAATATGHLAAIFTVVGVGTTTLATVTPTNVPLTVRTTASTTYLRDGLAARFKDLRAGSRITMSGKQAADGSFTATHIVILDAALTGRITSVSRTGFVLTLSPKAVVTIVLTATTKIVKPPAEQPVSLSALKSGQTVSVYGVPAVSGSFQAVIVAIRV